jgi:tetratricopeptide (TPR) repeat protein
LPARPNNDLSREEELLLSRQWKRFDVHNAFELGNLYLRRAEYGQSQGFQEEVRVNAEKALDAFTDALRANPSYDELFESRAEAFRLLNRKAESERDLRMAILINPLRKETSLSLESLRSKPH